MRKGKGMAQRKDTPVSETLRHAILTCGQSRYAISRATGINEGALSRFIHGRRNLGVETVGVLCEHLGLVLTPKDKK